MLIFTRSGDEADIEEKSPWGEDYCPRYHPIPYRSRKLVIIVSEFA